MNQNRMLYKYKGKDLPALKYLCLEVSSVNDIGLRPYFTSYKQDFKCFKLSIKQNFYLFQKIDEKRQFFILTVDEAREGKKVSSAYRPILYIKRSTQSAQKCTFYKFSNDDQHSYLSLLSEGYDTIQENIKQYSKNCLNKQYLIKLQQNSFFRFGKKFSFKVIGVFPFTTASEVQAINYFYRMINKINKEDHKFSENNQQSIEVCRICLTHEGQDPQDILITCCQCKGTCANIHISCLKQWMKDKYVVRYLPTGNNKLSVTICQFTRYFCEICKYSFPKVISHNGKIYNLIQIPVPKQPFIILRSQIVPNNYQIFILSPPQNIKKSRMMINKQGYGVCFGRSAPSDIILSFSSLSRIHAQIRFIENNDWPGNFYLKDFGSLNGTFIRARDQLQIQPGSQLQYNQYSFKFS